MAGPPGRAVGRLIQTEARIPSLPETARHDLPKDFFREPLPQIKSDQDLREFLRSQTVKRFVGFILALNSAIKGKLTSAPCRFGETVSKLVEIFQTLSGWVDELPPVKQPLRYGNPAFKQWHAKQAEAAPGLLAQLLPPVLQQAVQELVPYFVNSFGNATRIDYGTGHEMNFCALLYCLAAVGLLKEEDLQAVVTKVFIAYLKLMRKLQTTYWLEPAGSRGVWGLDDYQFLPFLWGSAQLIGHPSLQPSSIHNQKVLDEYGEECMYFGCVQFVKSVKKGPLQETSPLLNDISGVPHWEKVNGGMIKMYEAEVLSKFPIMQHFLCGSLLSFRDPSEPHRQS